MQAFLPLYTVCVCIIMIYILNRYDMSLPFAIPLTPSYPPPSGDTVAAKTMCKHFRMLQNTIQNCILLLLLM